MHVLWHSVNQLAACNARQSPTIMKCLISRCAKPTSAFDSSECGCSAEGDAYLPAKQARMASRVSPLSRNPSDTVLHDLL